MTMSVKATLTSTTGYDRISYLINNDKNNRFIGMSCQCFSYLNECCKETGRKVRKHPDQIVKYMVHPSLSSWVAKPEEGQVGNKEA